MANYPRAKDVPKAKRVSMKNPNKAKANSKAFDPKAVKKSVDSLIKQLEDPDVRKRLLSEPSKPKAVKKSVASAFFGPPPQEFKVKIGGAPSSASKKAAPTSMSQKAIPALPALLASGVEVDVKGPEYGKYGKSAPGQPVKKGAGGLLGAGAGGALGSFGGPVTGALGALAGGALGGEVEKKSKVKVKKGIGGLLGAGIGGALGSFGGPVTGGLGALAGSALGGEFGKGEEKEETEEEKEARKDYLKTKSQASLRVEKAIHYLQGYVPMSDESVMKSFHGQIPDMMKEVELRPPQSWWNISIVKATEFGSADPVKYSLDLWYNIPDVNKAVAEDIDSKYSPEKKDEGEKEAISDGSRSDTKDLKPSKTTVTN